MFQGRMMMNAEEKRFARYLDDKYGKEFIVNNIKTTGGGLGVEGYRQGEAYVKGEQSIKFNVLYSTRNKDTGPQYNDTYLNTIWSHQETQDIKQFLVSVFDKVPDYAVSLTPSRMVRESVRGEVPTFETLADQYPNEISYSLSVKLQGDFSDSTRSQHLMNAYKLVEFLKGKNNLDTQLLYSIYRTEPEGARQECILSHQDLLQVKGSDDLVNCFTKRGVDRAE